MHSFDVLIKNVMYFVTKEKIHVSLCINKKNNVFCHIRKNRHIFNKCEKYVLLCDTTFLPSFFWILPFIQAKKNLSPASSSLIFHCA